MKSPVGGPNEAWLLDFYLRSYGWLREELLLRHRLRERAFYLALLGNAALISVGFDQNDVLFILPVFSVLCWVNELYHWQAKSRLAMYLRVVEEFIGERVGRPLPMWEEVGGTFGKVAASRNMEGIWMMRGGLLPFIICCSIFWWLFSGPVGVLESLFVLAALVYSLIAFRVFRRLEVRAEGMFFELLSFRR